MRPRGCNNSNVTQRVKGGQIAALLQGWRLMFVIPGTQEAQAKEQEVQSLSGLQGEFKASLGYLLKT